MDELDIIEIHRKIIKEMDSEFERLHVYKIKTSALEKLLSCDIHSHIKTDLRCELEYLQHYIEDLSKQKEKKFYLMNVIPLLNEYKKELNKPICLNFMDSTVKPDLTHKISLQHKFMTICRKYVPELINGIEARDIKECSICSKKCMVMASSLSMYTCENCGNEEDIIQIIFSYRDNERINITTKYTYVRRIHFRDCINQFQGKQHSTISDVVYEKLYEQLRNHGLEDTRALTKEERYKKVTKRHIIMFLKETNFATHYEDLNLIYHTITGAKLSDISHLEEVLIQDFDILNELYDKMYIKTKKITRKNFINTQYVLYQLLKRHKFPCKRSDFNFLKTTERKCFHDTICSDLFKQLGWNFQAIF